MAPYGTACTRESKNFRITDRLFSTFRPSTTSARSAFTASGHYIGRTRSARTDATAATKFCADSPQELFEKARQTQHNIYGDDFAEALLNEVDDEVAEHGSLGARLRSWLAHILMNQRFETCIGTVILLNFVVIALETDARARQQHAAPDSPDRYAEKSLSVIAVLHTIALFVYILECAVRLYVLRCNFFTYFWNNFDLFMVVICVFAEIVEKANFDALDGLRALRILRMLRTTRVLVCFDELYALVSGLAHATKGLMWAAILMLMVLTIWSIFAVEYVRPLMDEVASKHGFEGCGWCPSAFDNVFLSNLSFFQIVTGDGWSHVARPLIEEHAWTAFLFVAVIFSVVFGLLNLIVAVIVDSAQQAREADTATVAARKEASRVAAWDCFTAMVGELDKNDDGEISIEELRAALDVSKDNENEQLASYLTAMGVELADLDMVFELLDSDGDGKITDTEFTSQLYQMKTQELPITLCYVRNSVNQLHDELEAASHAIQAKLDQMLRPYADVAATSACKSMHEVPDLPPMSEEAAGMSSTVDMTPLTTELQVTNPARKRPRGTMIRGTPPPTMHAPRNSALSAVKVGKPSTAKTSYRASIATSASNPSRVSPVRVSFLDPNGAVTDITPRLSNISCKH